MPLSNVQVPLSSQVATHLVTQLTLTSICCSCYFILSFSTSSAAYASLASCVFLKDSRVCLARDSLCVLFAKSVLMLIIFRIAFNRKILCQILKLLKCQEDIIIDTEIKKDLNAKTINPSPTKSCQADMSQKGRELRRLKMNWRKAW